MQHSEKVSLEQLRSDVMDKVIKTVIPEQYFDANTIVHINPCGLFIIGGPMVIKTKKEKKIISISSKLATDFIAYYFPSIYPG